MNSIPVSERKMSQAFANLCAWMLSQHLKKSDFYFTYCHALRAGHIGLESELVCETCKVKHDWLTLSRDTVKQLADNKMPPEVANFIDLQIKKSE